MMARKPKSESESESESKGFNGAAPMMARKLHSSLHIDDHSITLQWSRANDGAETPKSRGILRYDGLASMEPRQ